MLTPGDKCQVTSDKLKTKSPVPGLLVTRHMSHATLLYLLYLIKIQLHGRRAPEDGHHYTQSGAILVDLIHDAVEVLERTVRNLDVLVPVKLELRLGMFGRHFHAMDNPVNFFSSERAGPLTGPHKSRDPRSGTHHVPGVIVHFHLHQHIARVEELGSHYFLPLAHLDDIFRGDHDLTE